MNKTFKEVTEVKALPKEFTIDIKYVKGFAQRRYYWYRAQELDHAKSLAGMIEDLMEEMGYRSK